MGADEIGAALSQHAVAMAVADSVAEGVIPADEADNLFICVGVFIHWEASDDEKIQDFNYRATKESIARAVKGEPKAAEVIAKRDQVIASFLVYPVPIGPFIYLPVDRCDVPHKFVHLAVCDRATSPWKKEPATSECTGKWGDPNEGLITFASSRSCVALYLTLAITLITPSLSLARSTSASMALCAWASGPSVAALRTFICCASRWTSN
jgi:Formaldehyde-activating enzyme (Fae)